MDAKGTIKAGLIVIGGGGAGLAAAVAAAEKGVKVIVLEKARVTGGNFRLVEGLFATESPVQRRMVIDVRSDDMFRSGMEFAHWKLNAGLLRAFINKSGDTIRWLEEKGVIFSSIPPLSPRDLIRTWHNPSKGGVEIMSALLKQSAELGVRIFVNTAAKKILTNDSGKVIGVLAEKDGAKLQFAAKSVIIATGGYGGNKGMLKKYDPDYSEEFMLYGMPHQGDGIVMATEIGVATEGLGALHQTGPFFPGRSRAGSLAYAPNSLWVNKRGERFTDESNLSHPTISVNALFRQPGKVSYTIVDDKIVQNIQKAGSARAYVTSLVNSSETTLPDLKKDLNMASQGLVDTTHVDREICNGCGACVDVCAANAITLDTLVADKAEIPPCRFACPAGVDMRRYLYLLRMNKIDEAMDVLRESLPLPSITGRVCPHPCETDCARNKVDEAVNINALERYVADRWLHEKARPMPRKHTSKVAVIGSGPAGLSCAYFLTRMGYPVTVFETQLIPGGMLRMGIPEYRLPRKILNEQINYIKDMGVEIKTGVTVGKDITFEELNKNYRAIFLATGNQLSRKIELKGAEHKDVLWGLNFLRAVNLKQKVTIKDRVVVIGGGNVAIDVALTALRLGAKEVQLACLERGDQIPAYREELDQAVKEGVKIYDGWGPKVILSNGEKVTGINLVRCTSVYDDQGKFKPSFDEKSVKTLIADMIILAIGQAPDLSLVPRLMKLAENGTVQTDSVTLQTSIPGIFAGGDIVAGSPSVVKAIADGRTAADSIDRYLEGKDLKRGRNTLPEIVKNPPKEGIPPLARMQTPAAELKSTIGNFLEVKAGFDEETARLEVQRCMTCGSCSTIDAETCIECNVCAVSCPVTAMDRAPVKKIKPLVKILNSVEEVAQWIGAEPKVLKATIDEYNAFCDDGYDAKFGKERRYLQALRTPPYYVLKCGVMYIDTMGGLRVNQHLEAVDSEDKPIPGLYAAGMDVGGWVGDTYNVYLTGSSSGFAINSGRIAGENAARYSAGVTNK